ncbi:Uncharacterized [Syntrophomonas zehnderi OL-4]|uniref:Uncharacterized n=1 Tax=Syntrophomonas zehnderi OL-4 TaxID=690567 RepID=A0A0E4GBV6_9FIRM|nr:hypothetical protein [Syntrophomonas zehnderi]CFW97255.1 Uncharacterized [Syntrophomonas zehnderi OL-4]
MKKQSHKKYAFIITIAAVLGLVFTTPMLAQTVHKTPEKPKVALAQKGTSGQESKAAAEAKGDVSKNETVYVKLNADGAVKDTTVVSWFHFDGNVPENIKDPVQLEQIKALNGSFKVKKSADGVVLSDLNSDQKDIYYSGKTKQALPIKTSIQYYLNGKAVNPERLPGKSGEVKIVVKIDNQMKSQETLAYTNAGQVQHATREVYTPLMTMVSVDLPIEKFSQVDAPEGMVTVVGEKMKVNWVLFPYPEAEAVLTMQAKDFEMDAINMVVQPKMPPLPDIDMESKLSELSEGITQLDQALEQVEDGSKQLADGQSKLADAVNKIKSGIGQLIALNKAEEQLAQGALLINGKMIESIQAYADNPAVGGIIKPLLVGLEKQKSTLTTLVQGGEVNGQKLPPMSVTSNSLESAQNALGQVAEGSNSSRQAAEKINSGIGQIRQQGINSIRSGIDQSVNELHIGEAQKRVMETKVDRFDTYMGKDANVAGKVQFVIQTEELR